MIYQLSLTLNRRKQLTKILEIDQDSLGVWECEVFDGAIKTAPAQSQTPRKKEWASIIKGHNPKAPGGKDRVYLKNGPEGFLYSIKDLKVGHRVEFVADYTLGSDIRILTKVLDISNNLLVLEIIKETKTKNLSKANKAQGKEQVKTENKAKPETKTKPQVKAKPAKPKPANKAKPTKPKPAANPKSKKYF